MTILPEIFLVPWFMFSIINAMGAGMEAAQAWAGQPLNAILLILLVTGAFYHAALGLQVVIEDYVHNEACKIASLTAMTFAVVIVGIACVVSVLKLAFGG